MISWSVPRRIVEQTESALASRRSEVFAFWTAPVEPKETVSISRLVVPRQDAHSGAGGEYVHIDGGELARVDVGNFERGERNVAQIHTHPSCDVRMSGLDRRWEVVKHAGALSIIVPNYARGGMDFGSANIYEREGAGWRLWGRGEFGRRFDVT